MLSMLMGKQTPTLISIMGPVLPAGECCQLPLKVQRMLLVYRIKVLHCQLLKIFLDAASLIRLNFFVIGKTGTLRLVRTCPDVRTPGNGPWKTVSVNWLI